MTIPFGEYLRFNSSLKELRCDKVALTDAQIKALPTTGVSLVAAPGAGKAITPLFAEARIDAAAGAYTNVNAAGFMHFRINGVSVLERVTNVPDTLQLALGAKVGGTAGWVLGGANDLPYLATLPASQAASTLVVPLAGLRVGDTITGFRIVAQVESAGGTVTIDAILRAVTNVAADPTDAAIGAGMTQVSVTADTAVSQSKTGLTEVVTSGKTYYVLITATSGAATDIILQACEITTETGTVVSLTALLAASINSAWVNRVTKRIQAPLSTLQNQALSLAIDNAGGGNLTGGNAANTGAVTVFYLIG